MKKRILFVALLGICVAVFLSSCEDGIFGSKVINRAYINVYTSGSKSLSGTPVQFPVSSKDLTDADFRRMESQFAYTNIVGLEFLDIESISGSFSTANNTSLTDIVFPISVKTIGDGVFRSSTNLTSIVFQGETPPTISKTAFPETFSTDCNFVVPRASRTAYAKTNALEPWLASGKNGHIRYIVTINFNPNVEKYPNLTVPVQGTIVSEVYSECDPSVGFVSPTSTGWTFDGYFVEQNEKLTTVTDADGIFESEVGDWISTGKMIAEEDYITVYAHWTENEYTITFENTTETILGETTSTKLKYTERYRLSDEGLKKKGVCVVGWKTTTTDGVGEIYYKDTDISKLCAENNGSVTLYSVWATKDFYDYNVEYWFMDTSGTDYVKDESRDKLLSARPYSSITVDTPAVTGFTYNSTKSSPTDYLNSDLEMVFGVYYDRNIYAIDWLDGNNDVITTTNVYYDTMPAYTDTTTPTKLSSVENDYTFNEKWLPEIVVATADTAYTAQFDSSLRKYTVNILVNNDEYGSISDTSVTDVEYGTKIITSGTQIIISDTNIYKTVVAKESSTTTDYTYSFDKWTGAAEVIGDVEVTANFNRANNPRVTTPTELYMDTTLYIYYSYNKQYIGARPDTYSTSIKYHDTCVNIGTGSYAPIYTGHTLEGFYLTSDCSGAKVMNADGTFVMNFTENSVNYTDSTGWCITDGRVVKFYAKWN